VDSPPVRISKALILELRRRDRSAMEVFFDHYFDRVYGYVHRMVGNADDAEDITQIAFMKMHRAIDTLDSERDPTPWVFTVAANAIRDFWRSRRQRESRMEYTLEDHPHALGLVEYQTPETDLHTSDMLTQVERNMNLLSESLRSLLVLRDIEGLSYVEIAGVLEIEEATARKRHSRAIQELRKLMQETDVKEQDFS